MVSKRVLVTEASGIIGQAMVRALVRAGYAVRAAMSCAILNFMTTHDVARAATRARVGRFVFLSSVRAQTGITSAEVVREQDLTPT